MQIPIDVFSLHAQSCNVSAEFKRTKVYGLYVSTLRCAFFFLTLIKMNKQLFVHGTVVN